MEMSQMTSNDVQSQLDIYLDEGSYVGNDLDVLEYWKLNKHRFPELAIMACDILSIPITIVASESSFSIGGRILHKYGNCLLPKTVQALICTRNWLHDFKETGPSGKKCLFLELFFVFFLFLTYNLQNKHFCFMNCRCAGSRGYSII